jgi:hypothetical protein
MGCQVDPQSWGKTAAAGQAAGRPGLQLMEIDPFIDALGMALPTAQIFIITGQYFFGRTLPGPARST